MGYSKENYGYVEGILAKRRQESELLAEKHRLEVYALVVRLAERSI